MSRYSGIRDFVKARLDTIAGWSFKTVPAGRAFIDRPDSYPGGTWSLDETAVIDKRAVAKQYWRKRNVTGYVLLYGAADGSSSGNAEAVAGSGVDLVFDALDGQIPTGMPTDTIPFPIDTDTAEPFAVDGNAFGVAIAVICPIEWFTDMA